MQQFLPGQTQNGGQSYLPGQSQNGGQSFLPGVNTPGITGHTFQPAAYYPSSAGSYAGPTVGQLAGSPYAQYDDPTTVNTIHGMLSPNAGQAYLPGVPTPAGNNQQYLTGVGTPGSLSGIDHLMNTLYGSTPTQGQIPTQGQVNLPQPFSQPQGFDAYLHGILSNPQFQSHIHSLLQGMIG